jgi:hypothetical protein
MSSMTTFDASEAPLLFVVGTALVLVAFALVLYVAEVRRLGAGSWRERDNDRPSVLPLRKSGPSPTASHRGRAPRFVHRSRAA